MKIRKAVTGVTLGLVALAGLVYLISSGVQAANPGARTLTLAYDGATDSLVATYDTTADPDRYVTTTGSGGPVMWGVSLMEADPSGAFSRKVTLDPSGTIYNFTATWYDMNQIQMQTISQSWTKP
jgi:hypothetical protein